jgi:hypothetical protein
MHSCSHCKLPKLFVNIFGGICTNYCVLSSLEHSEVVFHFQRVLFSQPGYYGDVYTGLRTDGVGIYSPRRYFSDPVLRHTGAEVHKASYRMWIRVLSPGIKRSGREVYVPQSSVKLENI